MELELYTRTHIHGNSISSLQTYSVCEYFLHER